VTSQPVRRRIEDFRFDTGAVWLDLLATVGNAYGSVPVERLGSVERFGEWLAAESLTPARPPTGADLDGARRLRDTLRSLGLAVVRGGPVRESDLRDLNAALAAEEPGRVRRSPHGRVTLAPPATPAAALARVARSAAGTLAAPDARLRTCDDSDCGMLFLDPTGQRRWCSTQLCGVKHRVRAHRARQQAGEPR
jgi:predicted RNA-binding Zn ribbon-like protein